MIKFIKQRDDFHRETEKYNKIFKSENIFPCNIFSDRIMFIISFEFDLIYTELFFDGIQTFLNSINEDNFTFYTINPNPDKYFYKNFGKYSVGVINQNTNYDDYMIFLYDNPGNEADCLIYNAETITIFSDESNWGIVGSKDWEIGIVGFQNVKIGHKFLDSFGEDRDIFLSLSDRIEELDDMFHFSAKAAKEYSLLLSNYSSYKSLL